MIVALVSATLLLSLVYLLLAWVCRVGFRRVHLAAGKDTDQAAKPPRVTVIVAARNEAGTIGSCLDSLSNLRYPEHLVDFLVVNDHSTDATGQIIDRHPINQRSTFTVINAPVDSRGKQQAIRLALAHARTEVILCTDADCTVAETWIQAMVGQLKGRTAFVAGPVLYRYDRSLGQRMQALEFLGLVAIGAGSIGCGLPTICNSANLCYRKSVFMAAADRMPDSADEPGFDETLLQTIHRDGEWRVAFCPGERAAVTTSPTRSLSTFLKQRVRWAATGGRMPDIRVVLVSVAIVLYYLTLTALGFAAVFAGVSAWVFLFALVPKLVADGLIVATAVKAYRREGLLAAFPVAELVHIPYILLSVVLGLTVRRSW